MTPTTSPANAEVNAFIQTFAGSEATPVPEPTSAAQPTQQTADGAAPPSPAAQSSPGEQPGQPAAPTTQEAAPAAGQEAPVVDIESIAREYGLDLTNAQQRGAAERLLSQQTTPQGGATPAPAPVIIDVAKLDEVLLAGLTSAPAAPTPAVAPPPVQPPAGATDPTKPAAAADGTAQPSQPQGNPIDDGFTWKDERDAMTDFDAAFDKRDIEGMAKVQRGIIMRYMAPVVSAFQAQIAQLEAQLKEVTPEVRQSRQAKQQEEDTLVAQASLRAQLPDFDELFADAPNGQTVTINGQTLPATPINRVIAAYPHIMNIRVEDANPRIAQRKTLAAQYEMAYRMYQGMRTPKLTPEAAKKAFDAGQQAAAVSQQHQTRQVLTAPGTPAPAARPKGYVSEIMAATGDGASIYK